MVRMTLNADSTFGIEGYNIPHFNHPFPKGISNLFPKEKGKGFAEI